jgi:hypothetical protein
MGEWTVGMRWNAALQGRYTETVEVDHPRFGVSHVFGRLLHTSITGHDINDSTFPFIFWVKILINIQYHSVSW